MSGPQLNGWIILDKPVGIGSTSCVGAVKRVLRQAGVPKTKVGHGGTLDPLASGVLPIALGEATKLCGRMLDATKAYEFTIEFGIETDTLDAEGTAVERSTVRPSWRDVEAVLPRFTGEIEQVPPTYSALKVSGKRAYDLARAGELVELTSRRTTIHSLLPLEAADIDGATQEEPGELTLAASVSKGTYIRSLARDIARALGTVGHVTMLRRTRAGPFTLEQAISLDFLEEAAKARTLDGAVLPLVAGLDDIPALPVSSHEAQLLRHGQKLPGPPAQGPRRSSTSMGPQAGLYLATDDDRPVALVEASPDGLKVVRGFNL